MEGDFKNCCFNIYEDTKVREIDPDDPYQINAINEIPHEHLKELYTQVVENPKVEKNFCLQEVITEAVSKNDCKLTNIF